MTGRSTRDGSLSQMEILFVPRNGQEPEQVYVPDPSDLMQVKSKFLGNYRNADFLFKCFEKMTEKHLNLSSPESWIAVFKLKIPTWNITDTIDFHTPDVINAINDVNNA